MRYDFHTAPGPGAYLRGLLCSRFWTVLKSYSGHCRYTKICYNEDEEENQPGMDSAFGRILREQGVSWSKNQHMMDDCEPLKEYAWLVDAVRRHQSKKMDLDVAVDAALDEMPNEYVIKTFLLENRAEVKSMFLTEYNASIRICKDRNVLKESEKAK